jgi:hypothetical protein
MHVAAEHGHVRTLAESWMLCWIHNTRNGGCRAYSHRRGQRCSGGGAECVGAGTSSIRDIEPNTPDGTPVFTVPPSAPGQP